MSRRLERESTVLHGIPTPEDSTMSTGTTPKREEVEVYWSDIPEDTPQGSFHTMDGYQNGIVATMSRKSQQTRDQFQQSSSVGPHNGLEMVGQNVKRLIDAIEELKEIGLKNHATCLPELVLVGDQSSGKSSLMSAIAGIHLQRGSGTCTRCPTNIRTSEAETWTCRVALQELYDYDPKSRNGPFLHWIERREALLKPFKTIADKSELEEVLKWAQIAFLNPDKDSSLFVPGTAGHAQEALRRNGNHREQAIFSPNVISVSISGPRLPNLSFYDLPGVFSTYAAEDEKEGPKFCENLTIKYVKHERALIICAMSMKNDPGVSLTKSIIAKCKANDRCVGALTMPDLMQGESHDDYSAIFQNKAFVLPNGYFVTKQPGVNSPLYTNPTASDYHRRALLEEEEYFNKSRLYGQGGKWSHFRERCGTAVIQEFLSTEFTKMILRSIPDIEKDVRTQAKEIREKLEALPEVSHDQAQFVVRERLREFSIIAEKSLAGETKPAKDRSPLHHQDSLHHQWRILSRQFQAALDQMQPETICTFPGDGARSRNEDQINLVSDDEEEEGSVVRTPLKRQATESLTRTPTKRLFQSRPQTPVKQEPMASPSGVRRPTSATQRVARYGPFSQDYLGSGRNSMSMADLQKAIEINSISGWPDHISHELKQELALTAIRPWKFPLQTFHEATFALLRKEMQNTLSDVLQNYKDTLLYRYAEQHITDYVDCHEKIQQERLMTIYDIEQAALFTMNIQGFKEFKQQALHKLTAARREARIEAWLSNLVINKGQKDKDQLRKNVKEKDIAKYQQFQRELDVAAYIIGYYHLARVRFTEAVCGNMKVASFEGMKKGIRFLLETKLELNSGDCEEKCKMLLSGNAALARQRNELLKIQKKLEAANNVLERIRILSDYNGRDDSDGRESEATIQSGANVDVEMTEGHNGRGSF